MKDPAAVSLGRRGGLTGGKARAASMTPEQRSEAARHAATARWATTRGSPDVASELVVLTEDEAEAIYQMLLNWALGGKHHTADAEEAMSWLGFVSPFDERNRW